jgi:hypothetical protein
VQTENLSSNLWAWRKYGKKSIKGSPIIGKILGSSLLMTSLLSYWRNLWAAQFIGWCIKISALGKSMLSCFF